MNGQVFLVGAGPGDPDLLTVRALRLLGSADVIVHDYLVSARMLVPARASAEIICVGAPHTTNTRLGQADIEALLVERARAGKQVVRLKNGDPMLFGRGGEEAQALARAGILFTIVPGVSSALAVPAYAGIPVTHRDHASLVTIATGHQASCAPGSASEPPALPWAALATQGGTLVFVMGMRALGAIVEALLQHGLAPETPAAVIHRGTTGRQVTVTATLADLPGQVREARLAAPSVIVVGHVVSLRAHMQWFEQRPLFGRRVVVTRPREQAGELVCLLEEQGAEVVLFPTIQIVPPSNPAIFTRAMAQLASYDWIVFTSVNGVRSFIDHLAVSGRDVRELGRARLAAIGPETAGALERWLLRPAVVPTDFRAEGLLDALAGEDLRGQRFLLPRASGARAILPAQLTARGAHVDEVVAYETVVPAGLDVDGLRAELAAGQIDGVTFTSSSTVLNFVQLLGTDAFRTECSPAVACIGPVTAATARELGLDVAVEARSYTAAGLADALVAFFQQPLGS